MSISIYEVKERHEPNLMKITGVNGVGIGDGYNGELVIKVYVEKKTADMEKGLPKNIEGFEVEIEEIGEISAF